MGRERERKSSVQQLWQAKPRASAAAASSSPAGGEKVHQLGGAVYGEEAEGLGTEQEAGVMRGGGAAEGSSAASMKDLQANRTKVVVRHLPPSLSEQVFLEQIESKYGDAYTWVAFFPGKSSHRRHIHSRAYINFKSTDHVFDFYEEFDGHVFVSERGAQFKAVVEYAPYQRAPELSLKKDVREGTIFKAFVTDPEYLEFMEMLAKPMEYLPSAEVQLERREAEKAASMASGVIKEPAVITPLMEYVRNKRAAKAAPQRSASFSRKLALRAGIGGASPKNFSAKKRGVDRSKAHTQTHSLDIIVPTMTSKKEVHALASSKEEYQGDHDLQLKRRNDRDEVKDRKIVSATALRGNSIRMGTDGTKEIASSYSPKEGLATIARFSEGASGGVDVRKDVMKREILRKQLVEKAKNKEVSSENTYGNSLYLNKESGAISLKHRPPVSPKITSAVQQQQRAPSPGGSVSTNSTSKQMNRRESAGKSSRGSVSLSKEQGVVQADYPTQNRDHSVQTEKRLLRLQVSRMSSKDHAFSLSTSLSPSEAEVGLQQLNLESKVQADGLTNNQSAIYLASPISGSDRQDARRVKNKDRPDRPVWTPRRRADNSQGADISVSMATSTKLSESSVASVLGSDNTLTETGDTSSYNKTSVPSMGEKEFEQQLIGLPFDHERFDGSYHSIRNCVGDNHTLGVAKIASRKDRLIQGVKEYDGILLPPEAGKLSKRTGGALVIAANEKQMWVAKSTSGP
ncbi:hypothetical protein O6H91_23G051500 [Diphasiastrum complanatum]|uniref:Uncharacterized protein n=2 Tax=Diphasiastrum complanatum TaxID=34168 RepID=A0ACC2ACI2_DIPCM|nr:hypothetical protein O6H91_23G051500 [Diphasiastrum complanatum]KAJ7514599.1 hypothetical protein O6H91_23G051500 [Diphasiastrum complanatum]